jgi:hypothetical protein
MCAVVPPGTSGGDVQDAGEGEKTPENPKSPSRKRNKHKDENEEKRKVEERKGEKKERNGKRKGERAERRGTCVAHLFWGIATCWSRRVAGQWRMNDSEDKLGSMRRTWMRGKWNRTAKVDQVAFSTISILSTYRTTPGCKTNLLPLKKSRRKWGAWS